jgi:tetratricopeptide (TPR) repeat protein
VNHDDRANPPPEGDRQWSVEEVAGLFNEFAETIAEIVTPERTESALQNLLGRLKSDQNNGADLGKPVQERQPLIPPAKISQYASDKAAEVFPGGAGTPLLLGGLLSGQARAAADHDDTGAGGLLPHCGGALRIEGAAHLTASLNQQRHGNPPRTDDNKPGHAWPYTALIAGTIARRRAEVNFVQSRDIGRAADSTVEALAPLAVSSRDLRMMNPSDREETQALLAGARELLSRCPAGALGAEGSAMVLGTVATLAERLIAGRDERAALSLVRAASGHLKVLGRHEPIAFEVRRAEAEALSELGQYLQAETMLRRLADDEQRAGGAADPRTVLLMHWAVVGRDRPFRAEEGYSSLEDRLKGAKRDPSIDRLLLHTRCRRAWVFGQLGRTEDSVSAYDQVISDRTRVLGKGHAETLDARHSQLKALVIAGQFERALPFLERLLDGREDAQGADHPDTLETRKYHRVALALAEPHDCALRDAIRDLEEILHVQKKRLGPDHPMSRDTDAWLDRLLHVQANHDREQAARLSPAATAEDPAAAVDAEPDQRASATARHRPVLVGW